MNAKMLLRTVKLESAREREKEAALEAARQSRRRGGANGASELLAPAPSS